MTYIHSKKLFDFSKIIIFLFCYEFLLQLQKKWEIFSTYEANIINIDDCYNKLSSLFIIKQYIPTLDIHCLNPRANIDLVRVCYQDKPACLKLYNALQSHQTLFYLPGSLNVSDYFIYIFLSKLLYRQAVFISTLQISQYSREATVRNRHAVSQQITRENDLSKSIFLI